MKNISLVKLKRIADIFGSFSWSDKKTIASDVPVKRLTVAGLSTLKWELIYKTKVRLNEQNFLQQGDIIVPRTIYAKQLKPIVFKPPSRDDDYYKNILIADNLFVIRLDVDSPIEADFLCWYLSSFGGKNLNLKPHKTPAITILTVGALEIFPVPTEPPTAMQELFESIQNLQEQIQSFQEQINNSQEKLETLKLEFKNYLV